MEQQGHTDLVAHDATPAGPPSSPALSPLTENLPPPQLLAAGESDAESKNVIESPGVSPTGQAAGASANNDTPTSALRSLQIASPQIASPLPVLASSQTAHEFSNVDRRGIFHHNFFDVDRHSRPWAARPRAPFREPVQPAESSQRQRQPGNCPNQLTISLNDNGWWNNSSRTSDVDQELYRRTATHICGGIYIGPVHAADDAKWLAENNIGVVLSMCERTSVRSVDSAHRDVHYHHLPCQDRPEQDIMQLFAQAHRYMDCALRRRAGMLVHCHAGISRSATIVISYMMSRARLSLRDSFAKCRFMRPMVCPNSGFVKQLLRFERFLYNKNSLTFGEFRNPRYWTSSHALESGVYQPKFRVQDMNEVEEPDRRTLYSPTKKNVPGRFGKDA